MKKNATGSFFWLAAVLLLYYLNGTLPLTDSVEGNYAPYGQGNGCEWRLFIPPDLWQVLV